MHTQGGESNVPTYVYLNLCLRFYIIDDSSVWATSAESSGCVLCVVCVQDCYVVIQKTTVVMMERLQQILRVDAVSQSLNAIMHTS